LSKLQVARKSIFASENAGITRPELEYAIAHCLSFKDLNFFLLVFANGEAEVLDQVELELNYGSGLLAETPHILININAACKKIFPKLRLPAPSLAYSLSEKELDIISAIRAGEYDDIEIHLRDGEIHRLELKERHREADISLAEFLKKASYGEMTIKIQDGRPVLTELVTSKKI
jgi:hypothetical protein